MTVALIGSCLQLAVNQDIINGGGDFSARVCQDDHSQTDMEKHVNPHDFPVTTFSQISSLIRKSSPLHRHCIHKVLVHFRLY